MIEIQTIDGGQKGARLNLKIPRPENTTSKIGQKMPKLCIKYQD